MKFGSVAIERANNFTSESMDVTKYRSGQVRDIAQGERRIAKWASTTEAFDLNEVGSQLGAFNTSQFFK